MYATRCGEEKIFGLAGSKGRANFCIAATALKSAFIVKCLVHVSIDMAVFMQV